MKGIANGGHGHGTVGALIERGGSVWVLSTQKGILVAEIKRFQRRVGGWLPGYSAECMS